MFDPEVSVILPVYNAEKYLGETLASLCRQTFERFEIIAINDGSSDRSLNLLKDWMERDRRIQVFDQTNSGLIATLNRGLELASCELIARADADDLYHPQRLELQYRAMIERPAVVLLGARAIKIDSNGRILYAEAQPEEEQLILESLSAGFGGVVPHPVAMFRKSAVIKAGRYRPEARHCEDLDLWIRLVSLGEVANLPQHLVYYRVHEESICATQWEEQRENAKVIVTEWLKKSGRAIPVHAIWTRPSQTKTWLARFRAEQASLQGFHVSAFRQVVSAIVSRPTDRAAWRVFTQCCFRVLKGGLGMIKKMCILSSWGCNKD